MKVVAYAVLIVAVAGYAAVCVAMYVFQRSLIYYPQPRAVASPGSTMKLPVDGAELVVTVRALDGAKAIVYFGGNAEDVSQNLAPYAQAFPGHALYFMHYRGYGGSTGEPTEQANVADGLALVHKVRALHPRIAIVGRSLGTGVAVQVAAQVAPSRLVLVTPFDSLVGIGAAMYPFLPVRWLARDPYESGKYASRLQVPTTLIEAERDEVIPRASTETLFARFPAGVATLKVIPGAGHNNVQDSKTYWEALQGALR